MCYIFQTYHYNNFCLICPVFFCSSSPTSTFELEDQNQTNNNICSPYDNSWTFTFIPVYILLISVLGIVFNVFVLIVFCLHKKACTTAEIYLSNLAAADLVLVSFLPFWAIYVSNQYNWTFGQVMCKVVSASILMNVYCSIYFMVLISFDRYLALVHPMSYTKIRRPKYAKFGCLLVWILGFLFSIPAYTYREISNNENKASCSVNHPTLTVGIASDAVIFVFGFGIPIFVIFFCTIRICKTLRSRSMEGVNTKKTDNKATNLILAVLLAFLICWVPFHLIKMPFVLRDLKILTECNFLKILLICRQIFTYFAYFNSVLNPILYVIVGRNFRKKVKDVFVQGDRKRTLTLRTTFTRAKVSRCL